jgi:hemolysin III
MLYQSLARRGELANVLTHGFGAAASAVGGSLLIALAANGDIWQLIGAIVFSISLVLLYTASTLYHGAQGATVKQRLEIVDHSAIFVLIAGTYTPFTLVSIRGVWGWSLFGVIWSLAIVGVVLKLFFTQRFHLLSTRTYIGMGWLVVVAAGPMISALPPLTIWLLVAGGVSYTAGTFFYHNERIPHTHAIWHLFVLGGSACHFAAVASQVVPV